MIKTEIFYDAVILFIILFAYLMAKDKGKKPTEEFLDSTIDTCFILIAIYVFS